MLAWVLRCLTDGIYLSLLMIVRKTLAGHIDSILSIPQRIDPSRTYDVKY